MDSTLLYSQLTGTSMSAPHIAGIVAQMVEARPAITPAQVEEILEDTARTITSAGVYEPDPGNVGGDGTTFDAGHGLVDAKAAIARVLRVTIPGDSAPPATAGTCSP